MCMRVGFIQTKNGLPAAFALSMNAMVLSRMTSSKVSMLYLMPSIGCGGSGPSSVIFCLPTLPQRGSTVGSSVSVAKVWRRLRGPTLSFSVLRIVGVERILHRIEVIEVAEELIEAVHRRQIFVAVAEMVLAELPGGVAHGLQHGGDGRRLRRHADRGAGLADGGQAGADRQLAGDEIGAAGGAARLGVVGVEQHALGGELVEVRRLAGHHAAVIGADVEPADIVAHDEEDVRLGVGLRERGSCARKDNCPSASMNVAARQNLDRGGVAARL